MLRSSLTLPVIGLACFALLVAGAGRAEAQAGAAVLRGQVVDAQQGVLPGVRLVATHSETGAVRQTLTGGEGTYNIANLAPGAYTLVTELQGFRRFVREGLVLEVGVTVSAIARYMSGTPFTIHDSNFDLDQNGIGTDPVAAGTYSGTGQTARRWTCSTRSSTPPTRRPH